MSPKILKANTQADIITEGLGKILGLLLLKRKWPTLFSKCEIIAHN